MLRLVALVRTDVSEEYITSIIRVTRIGELGTTLAGTSSRSALRRNTNLTKVARLHITKDGVLHSRLRENLKSYKDSACLLRVAGTK
jgi:hypothetical protein